MNHFDQEILGEITKKLEDHNLWDTTDVTAFVEDGEVTLTGTVADKESSDKTAAMIALVKGVKHVTNKLEIKGKGLVSLISEIGAQVARITTDKVEDKKTDE